MGPDIEGVCLSHLYTLRSSEFTEAINFLFGDCALPRLPSLGARAQVLWY